VAISLVDGSETQCGGGGSVAPAGASYVVLSLNDTLTAERVLTAGANITITDGGPGGTVTIASSGGGGGGAPTDAQYLVLSLNGSLSDERALAVTSGHLTLTDGGANGNATLGLAGVGTAGTYAYPSSVTTDAQGRVTAIAAGSTPALASVTVTAGAGMTGGGDLSASRTFNIAAADATITVNADSIQVGALQTANYSDDSVTDAKLRNSGALSVMGRAVNSAGNPSDIAVTSGTNYVLMEDSGSLEWSTILNANVSSVAAISHSKLADLTGASILGRSATSSGAMAAITGSTIGHVLTVQGDNSLAFSAPAGSSGYATIERPNGTPVTQRTILSLTTEFTATDNVDTTDIALATNGVALSKIAQLAGLSVLGVTGGSTANMAAITAGADGAVLRRASSTDVSFGTLLSSSFADTTIAGSRMSGFTNLRLAIGNSSGQLASSNLEYNSATGYLTHATDPLRIRAGNNNPYVELSTAGGSVLAYGSATSLTCGGSQVIVNGGSGALFSIGGTGSFGGTSCGLFLTNAGTPTSTTPSGGCILNSESGLVKIKDPTGTVTILN
jgi:hypothetical protein